MRHGGNLGPAIDRYGGSVEDWLDLSTGINPHPYPSELSEHASAGDRRLPEPAILKQMLAAARIAYRVPQNLSICAAPGTEILIRLQPRLLNGSSVLLPTTYGSYREAWAAAGKPLDVSVNSDLHSVPAGSNAIIVNPNNPDGRWIAQDDLIRCARSREASRLVVVDEAFCDAEPDRSIVGFLTDAMPVIVFRSFGKFFGLPGVRLGFAIGRADLIQPIADVLGDWPVSAQALRTGLSALSDLEWQKTMRGRLVATAGELDAALRDSGLDIVGGTPLFRLVRHIRPADVHAHLAEARIWTRIFDDAPEFIRIGLPAGAADAERLHRSLSTLQA